MGRAPCCSKIGLNRGPWSIEEDKLLIHYIQTHGEGHWRSLPSKAGLLRCGKSCRLRWVNYLRPGVKRGNFTSDENDTIIRLHSLHGNRWSLIAAEFPGRTDNEIKNHWNTHLRKKSRQDDLDKNVNPSQQSTVANYNTLVSSKSLSEAEVKIDIPSTQSSESEDDQRINITNNVISYDNHLTEQIKVESKMVNDNIATPTSSGASYSSSSVITEGEVNMNMNMNMNNGATDTFFYELDDFIDVDQKMKGCDYMISRDDGTKLERVYMEYVQLLNYGAE